MGDTFLSHMDTLSVRVTNLDAAENVAQFWTDERTTSVRSIDVKPHRLTVTDQPDLFQVVERTHSRRTQCRTHL